VATGTGSNVIVGGNGTVVLHTDGTLASATSDGTLTTEGAPTIAAGNGSNRIIGGAGVTSITAGNGANWVIGSEGTITVGATGTTIETQSASLASGGAAITLGTGS